MAITNSPAFEVMGPIGFGIPCTNYRRNLSTPAAAFDASQRVLFAAACTNYKRNLATPGNTVLISPATLAAGSFIRLPPVRGIYSLGVLIDVVAGVFLPGDSGIEIVYNIPNHLRIRPHLIAPATGSQHRLGSPVMVWTETLEAIYYEVHIARDIDFLQRVARVEVLGGELQRGWPFGGTYYWRVRAVAGNAYSDYSEVWSFTVPEFNPETFAGHDVDGRSRLLTQFREDA